MGKTTQSQPINFERPIARATFLTILNSASVLGEHRYMRQAALAWLASFPGDLYVNYLHALALFGEGKTSQAATIVNSLVEKDPEFVSAQELRANPLITSDAATRIKAAACVAALGGAQPAGMTVPEWSQLILKARQSIQAGNLDEAEEYVHQAIALETDSPLPAIYHLKLANLRQDNTAVENMATIYHTRWPECLQFALYLASSSTEDEAQSVALLHRCVAQDATAQVPARLWGENFTYKPLWPSQLYAYVNLPVPASVSADLGWNSLPVGQLTATATTSNMTAAQSQTNNPGSAGSPTNSHKLPENLLSAETLRSVQAVFERLANRLRVPEVSRADGRFPVYVIFSTRKGLETQYGPQTAAVIDTELHRLADAIRSRKNWGSIIFYADDSNSTSTFNVKPALYNDPWKLKLSLADLDAALAKKGEMIGALLIVGGPEVVPFHTLPNPTDDSDADVSSDNPYATLDENYFIPEWPVGRFPGGKGSDAGILLGSIRKSIAFHKTQTQSFGGWFQNWVRGKAAKSIKSLLPRPKSTAKVRPSFGYTASVWKESSTAVFRPIGESSAIIVSPPSCSGGSQGTILNPARLSYFNLHGLSDGSDWYGQRDVSDSQDGPDYPVALSISDVTNLSAKPQMIFTEACYGVHVLDKNEDQAMSLKFLSCGTNAIVGSSCIAYGSVTTPLIAADLLGYEFWKGLEEGQTVGNALLQAKVNLVQQMNDRQGYLDGEDQKTLISFMLFGDPLMTYEDNAKAKKNITRQRSHPTIKTVSDQKAVPNQAQPVPENVLAQVKKIVDEYLPGLEDGEMKISPAVATYFEGLNTAVGKSKKSPKNVKVPQRTVVTISKQVTFAAHVHKQFARVTLDKHGKMVKLCISR